MIQKHPLDPLENTSPPPTPACIDFPASLSSGSLFHTKKIQSYTLSPVLTVSKSGILPPLGSKYFLKLYLYSTLSSNHTITHCVGYKWSTCGFKIVGRLCTSYIIISFVQGRGHPLILLWSGLLTPVPHNYQKIDCRLQNLMSPKSSQQFMSSSTWAFFTEFEVKAEKPDLNCHVHEGHNFNLRHGTDRHMHDFCKALTIFWISD